MALTAADFFNDATTRMVGGIGPDQQDLVISDLVGTQMALKAAFPAINNLTDLHAKIIEGQIDAEVAYILNPVFQGTFTTRELNDIHRDIIDIAQADAGIQAVFNPTPLPAVNIPTTPFHDSAAQAAFLNQFIADSNSLGTAALNTNTHDQAAVNALVGQITTFANNANNFVHDQAQFGLYAARFINELGDRGTAGTSVNALIDGLQTGNQGEILAAAQQLSMNAADVAGNNRADNGDPFVAPAFNPPAAATAQVAAAGAATAGAAGTATAAADAGAAGTTTAANAAGNATHHHGGNAYVAGVDTGLAQFGHVHHGDGHHFGHMWG